MIRSLAVLGVLVIAAATAHGPHAARKTPGPLRVVRTKIVSGDGQHARAYAASHASKYIAEFPDALVLAVSGPPPPNDGDRIIVISCVTPGCTFASTDQPDEGAYIDRVGAVYKVKVVKGRAAVRVTLEGDDPTGSYSVKAEPSPRGGERGIPSTFTLTMR